MLAHLLQDCIGHFGADDGKQLAFVGDVEWIEAEDLAGTLTDSRIGIELFAQAACRRLRAWRFRSTW